MFFFYSEVNSGFFYKTAAERVKLVEAERAFTNQRVQKVIDFKKKVCDGTDKSFVIINQKVNIIIINSYQNSYQNIHICIYEAPVYI